MQHVHWESSERMLLASFVSGIVGVPGVEIDFQIHMI